MSRIITVAITMTVLQIRKNKKYHKPHEMTLKIAFKKFTPSGDKPNARQTNFTMAIIYYFSYWKKNETKIEFS